jgi:hypothetical protein
MKSYSRKVFILYSMTFVFMGRPLFSQGVQHQPDSTGESSVQSVVFLQDSVTRSSKAHLLPKNISFGEQLMWGEKGVMRSIGIVPDLSPQERKFELSLRRTMLTTHQIGGFVTLGLMASTAYYGQQVLNENRDPLRRRQLLRTHKTLITATIIGYTTTGLLSILSPPPMIRRDENSTTTLHKTLAWVHMAGMIITPIIGQAIKHSGASYDQVAQFHQIAGYVTTATFATSLIVITF